MKNISIIIPTFNEEINLPFCLDSLKSMDADVFIVDSGSVDKTVPIAQNAGCQVVFHEFQNQAKQINWALNHLAIKTPWVMRLDADERLTPALVEELKMILSRTADNINGFELKRRVYFMGQWIRHGGYYPTWLLRVWRNGAAFCEDRWMDEHMVLTNGQIEKLTGDIIDENRKGLNFFLQKHISFADREVQDINSSDPSEGNLNLQAGTKRWLKKGLYLRLPLFFRCFFYWLYRYFILLGFLDGKEGLVFHFLQGFWYRFLIDAKLFEMKKKGTK